MTSLSTLSQPAASALALHQTLASGLQLYVHPMPGAPRLAIHFYLPGGNALDEVTGQQDLISRLLTKGTRTRTAEDIAIAIDELSLELDTDTGRDYTVLSATLLKEDLAASLKLIYELLFESTLVELPKELERPEGELAMELDSPRARASDLLTATAYANTPYGVTSSVLQRTLPQLKQQTVESLMQAYKASYQTQALHVVVSGDCTLEALVPLFEDTFPPTGGNRAEALQQRMQLAESAIKGLCFTGKQRVAYPWPDANQCHIFKVWYAPTITQQAQYVPLMVLNTILGGGGLSSRLFTELRDKQGLAYNVRSSLEGAKAKGSFTLYIGTEPKNTQKCLAGFEQEIQKLIDTPVPAQELTDAKNNLLGRRTVYLETPTQWSSYLGSNLMLGRDPNTLAELDAAIEAVTAEAVQEVARTVLGQASLISLAGPPKVVEAFLANKL
jgi:zinc protease